jgi:haloacid dehalogenase superfamily, subfamily IA, variant 3 with third motif having DD or ED
MIRGIIFDFDGLIIDTEASSLLAWSEVYADYHCELPFEKWALCIGAGLDAFDPHAYLESLVGKKIPREPLEQRTRARHQELVEQEAALPGVEATIAAARQAGLRIAVASSSARDWVEGNLRLLGLVDKFNAIVCGDEVTHRKPHPELYLTALAALQLQPDEAFAFEDSPNGVFAAQNAGMICVAIPNPITARLSLEHADILLHSMADLPLAELIKRVEQCQKEKQQLGVRS